MRYIRMAMGLSFVSN